MGKNRLRIQNNLTGYAFIAPSAILLLFFAAIPIIMTFYYSFTNFNGMSKNDWLGWENYTRVLADKTVRKALFNTLRYVVTSVPLQTAISLAIALELNIKQTNILLGKAGYALSESDKRDVIVMFFIKQEIFDILELDGVLLENGQEMLTKYD